MIGMFMSATSDDAANIAAINTYVMTQPILTSKAGEIRNKWLKWHDNLGWYDKTFPSVTIYDQARNIRNEFNTANAITKEQKAAVEAVKQNGLTSEELRGETKRTTSEGDYNAPKPYIPEPEDETGDWLPLKTKVALGSVGILAAGVWALKKMYLDPWLPKRR